MDIHVSYEVVPHSIPDDAWLLYDKAVGGHEIRAAVVAEVMDILFKLHVIIEVDVLGERFVTMRTSMPNSVPNDKEQVNEWVKQEIEILYTMAIDAVCRNFNIDKDALVFNKDWLK